MLSLSDLKICFLALTLAQGGAERQLYYTVRSLHENGAMVRVLCLASDGYWKQQIEQLGVPVEWVGRSKSRFFRLKNILIALWRDRPHIIQSQHLFANPYVVLVARLLRLCEIGAVRNDGVTGTDQIGYLARRIALEWPHLLAVNSKLAIDNLEQRGVCAERMSLLSNVVDTVQFAPRKGQSRGAIRLLAVGRLVRQKRFDRFMTVFLKAQRSVDVPVKGVLVGDGPLRRQLEMRAEELGLFPDSFVFMGPTDDIAPIYREGDIFVLTSDWEGTPNVVLEAMASGLPVVATKVGGVSDLIKDGKSGYLVESGDEALMVRRLRQLVADSSLRYQMGARAREYVLTHHSLEALPKHLVHLYEMALATNGSRSRFNV